MTFFILIVCVIAVLFLVINFLFAPNNPDQEKYSIFECGFHSFLGQNRIPFDVNFFIYGIAFILFDGELFLLFPLAADSQAVEIYGLTIGLIFSILVTIGFVFELGKGALKIDSRQNIKGNKINSLNVTYLGSNDATSTHVLESAFFKFDYKSAIFKYFTWPNIFKYLITLSITLLLSSFFWEDLYNIIKINTNIENEFKIRALVIFVFGCIFLPLRLLLWGGFEYLSKFDSKSAIFKYFTLRRIFISLTLALIALSIRIFFWEDFSNFINIVNNFQIGALVVFVFGCISFVTFTLLLPLRLLLWVVFEVLSSNPVYQTHSGESNAFSCKPPMSAINAMDNTSSNTSGSGPSNPGTSNPGGERSSGPSAPQGISSASGSGSGSGSEMEKIAQRALRVLQASTPGNSSTGPQGPSTSGAPAPASATQTSPNQGTSTSATETSHQGSSLSITDAISSVDNMYKYLESWYNFEYQKRLKQANGDSRLVKPINCTDLGASFGRINITLPATTPDKKFWYHIKEICSDTFPKDKKYKGNVTILSILDELNRKR